MKIIDLLNRIAKGEEVPKKIRFDGVDYFIVNEMYPYTYKDYNGNEIEDNFTRYIIHSLDDEIEIIEEVEDKEYEDIEELNLDTDELLKKVVITAQDYVIEDKINALIRNQKKILERLDK